MRYVWGLVCLAACVRAQLAITTDSKEFALQGVKLHQHGICHVACMVQHKGTSES